MDSRHSTEFSIGRIASLACLLEVCASKPGNVHRGADFDNLTFTDFVVSAEILGQAIDTRKTDSVGELILETIRSTAAIVSTNSNLGIALLVSPLAIAANAGSLTQIMVRRILREMGAGDSRFIYEAIRIARPGGLGATSKMDVASHPPENILDAMEFSSDQDLVARQYVNDFQQVFDDVIPLLITGQLHFGSITESIIYTQVSLLARFGDSLIRRKCGDDVSAQAQMYARQALEQLIANSRESYCAKLAELDFWMRSDGHRRNPGTTADLIVAGLFVGIVNDQISPPFR